MATSALPVSLLFLALYCQSGGGLGVADQCRGVEDLKLNASVISPDSVLLTWDTSLQYLQLEVVFSFVGRR